MKRVLLVVVALVAGTACIPGRDNPFDPQNAPAAQLTVADAGPAVAGECPAVFTSSLQPVAFVSRGRCIVLDASGTSNPGNDERTFQFRLPPAAGSTTPQRVETTSLVLPLTGTYRRQLPVETQLTFEVAVSTDGGRSFGASASASVVLTNAPPVAVTDVSRSLPVGGFPWSLGTPFEVTFDASGSTDPDGDAPLQYCWTFPGETESCTAESVVTRTLPVTRGRMTASLRVTDNLDDGGVRLSSRRVPASVSVTDPVLWHSPLTLVQRIDTLRPVDLPFNTPREAVRYPATPASQSAMLVLVEDPAPGAGNPGASLRLVDEATGVVGGGSVSVPQNVEGIAADPARNRIWTLSVITGAAGASTLRAWSIPAPMSISPDASVPSVPLTFPVSGAYAGILEVAANGNVWATSLYSRYLYEVSPAGTVLATHEFPGRSVRDAAMRPGAQELWVVFDADLAPDGSAVAGSALAIYSTETGALLGGPLPLGNVAVSEIAWIDADQLWVSLIVDGLRVVDAGRIQSGTDVEAATITRIPDLAQVDGLVVDAGTGALWCSGTLGGVPHGFRATPAGDFEAFTAPPTTFGAEVFYVEPGGALWWTDGALPGRLHRSTAFDPDGTVVSVDVPSRLGAVDSTTGWLWYPLDLPSSLLQITGEGSIRRFVRTVEIDGVERSMPVLFRLRVEPGGPPSGVWRTISTRQRRRCIGSIVSIPTCRGRRSPHRSRPSLRRSTRRSSSRGPLAASSSGLSRCCRIRISRTFRS